eukprot:20634-Heterococcus_DN1.PRE.2
MLLTGRSRHAAMTLRVYCAIGSVDLGYGFCWRGVRKKIFPAEFARQVLASRISLKRSFRQTSC